MKSRKCKILDSNLLEHQMHVCNILWKLKGESSKQGNDYDPRYETLLLDALLLNPCFRVLRSLFKKEVKFEVVKIIPKLEILRASKTQFF